MRRLSEIVSHCDSEGIYYRVSEPLSRYSSLRIGGKADLIAFPESSKLSSLLRFVHSLQINRIVIGGGTNILFPDHGFRGLVICTKNIDHCFLEIDKGYISAGAGMSLWSLLMFAAENGLSGLEELAGIPGTIGGAIAGNAGSFGVEIKDVLLKALIVDYEGSVRSIDKDQLGLAYRSSSITGDMTLSEATLHLASGDREEIKRRMSEFAALKKQRQPVESASAGCVFKNPEGLSAGRLIDEAGCKGMRQGGIIVSPRHANFFINTGQGRAVDYLGLMDRVREKVYSVFGLSLESEIRIVA